MKKILFISPRISSNNGTNNFYTSSKKIFGKLIYAPGLEFFMLAAVTPENYTIKMIDDEYQKITFNEECDIVGITSTTPAANRAYEIADEFRKIGKTVVLGGWHPSALPEESKQHADSVVIGEGENNWLQLLKDYERGRLQPYYEQKQPVNMETIPPPARRKVYHSRGFIIQNIQATRGCTNGCRFCSITNSVLGKKFRFRSIDDIVEEIQSIPQKILLFCDPCLTLNPQYTKQLFKAIKDLNKKLYCNGTINILAKDDELLKLASEAGCIEWAIGFESISQESLNQMGKKTNNINEYSTAIKKIHDNNMGVFGNFMFGLDGDYPDIFTRTVDAISKWELDLAYLHIFTPYPGTPLYYKFEKEGRILSKDWSKYDLQHVVFQPKNMSPEKLMEGSLKAWDDLFSYDRRIKRGFGCLKYGFYHFLMIGFDNFLS